MQRIKEFAYRFRFEIFATLGAVIVLWQMLLPGYVLAWDMVFGPAHVFPSFSGLNNSFPLGLLIYGVGFVVPMWVVQKVILVGLFFSLFYLPIRFFPFKIDSWSRYAATTLYAVNPFVYERFLAGQWAVLCAYALLAPFLYFLLELVRLPAQAGESRARTAMYLALTMLLVGILSLHVFVMAAIIAVAVIAFAILRDVRKALRLVKYTALAGALVGVVSLYWIVPLVFNPQSSPLPIFTEVHWSVFQTSVDPTFGASANVLMLYGFWGESYPWMQGLPSPKDMPPVLIPSLLALSIVIVVGAVMSVRAREARSRLPAEASAKDGALALLGIAIAAFVFSLGLAPSIFHDFNQWLFEHVPFWRGFRDTEKWSMWLALAYAYFFAAGASYLVHAICPRLKSAAQCAFVLLPLVYTFTMLGGFAGQMRAVDYPESWYEVNAILAKDKECVALFLPWHQYYWLEFNDHALTANTAPSFFSCDIISSQDAEIGAIGDQGADEGYRAVAQVVMDNSPENISATLATLRAAGIRYIISTGDLTDLDTFTYPFSDEPNLKKLYTSTVNNQRITLLQI